MKKLISMFLMITLIGTALFSLTGCGNDEEDLSAKIEEKVGAYLTDLEDSKSTLTSVQAVRDYLCNWAKSKGIQYTADSHDNVIMRAAASKEYEEAPPTVVLCSYDPAQIDNCLDPMAVALYVIKNNEATGDLTVIFASEENHDFSGISSLNSKYFKDDANVFCLNGGSRNMWSFKTGGSSSYSFTNQLTYSVPEGEKAFKIKIEGLPGGIPDSKISSYPNAIKEIGDLLAYFKTNTLIYELADVSGGESGSLYPCSAEATIVIDEDDFEKFQTRIETAIETFNEDYLEDYPEVTYTYEEVSLPEQVLSQDSLNEFVSILYTLIDGVYARDEEDNLLSITSIGSVNMDDDAYRISAIGNGLYDASLKEIDNEYMTICGLSDVNYDKTGGKSPWSAPSDSEFAQAVSDAFNDYCGKDMEYKDYVSLANTSYVTEKNENCNIVNVTLNEDKIERYAGTIITFMLNQPHTEIAD